MDAYTRSFYQLKFQNTFLRLKGAAFQDFFAEIMSRCHPNDFIRTRPWGATGDRKNDGYLRSERKLFQVYAPNELSASETVSKIPEDFAGALHHWREFFDKWTFVHNALDGLGPDVLGCLLRLGNEHPEIDFSHMGYEAIEEKAFSLDQRNIQAILGYAPDARAVNGVRSSDLIEVLAGIAQTDTLSDVDINPISAEKIHKNFLSEDSKQYLRMGQRKSGLVAQIFSSFPDPLKGERVVQGFRNKYLDLKAQQLEPDRILSEVICYAGGYAEHYKGGAIEA